MTESLFATFEMASIKNVLPNEMDSQRVDILKQEVWRRAVQLICNLQSVVCGIRWRVVLM